MRRIFNFVFTVLILFCFLSCQKMSYQGHFLDEAKKVDSIQIEKGNLVLQGHENGGVAYFVIRLFPRQCKTEEYEEMWSYYKDNDYRGKRQTGVNVFDRSRYVGSFYIYDCRFVSIDVTALTAFNQSHPENSSLNDICWYSFPNHRSKEWIAGGYKGNIPTPVDCSINIGRLENVNPDDTALFNDQNSNYGVIPFRIYLDELPDDASVKIRIDIKDICGTTFSTEGLINR